MIMDENRRITALFENPTNGARRWHHEESSGRFWVENSKANWKALPLTMFKKYLRAKGYAAKPLRQEGQILSDLDQEIMDTMLEFGIDYAGPMAGRYRGIHRWGSTSALVTEDPYYISPVEGDWPILKAFLKDFLATEKGDQWHYFMGWMQDSLRAYYAGDGHKGLTLVLAGAVNSGKSRLKDFIKAMLGGREALAMANMTGKDMFNRELAECAVWTIDDEAADTRPSERAKFAAEVKKVTGNTGLRTRGMHKEGMTLEPMTRLIICVNSEPDKIVVLPELSEDVEDKILILKSELETWPMPMNNWDEKKAFVQTVESELPAFIYYMLNEYELPEAYVGARFTVKHFCHSDIFHELHAVSPEIELLDFIERAIFTGEVTNWTGSSSDLRHILLDDTNRLHDGERRRVPASAWIGKRLSRLAKTYPDRFSKSRQRDSDIWVIYPQNEQAEQETEETWK